jgi:DNA-binding NarL/FixJ family response regulator
MLTMYDDDESVSAAMRAGARGYVLKGADPEDIVRAIQAVASGSTILGRGVPWSDRSTGTPAAAEPAFPSLTPREREVLELIAQGLSNTAIADRLTVSISTVGNHVTSIFAKLLVANRAEAIVLARDAAPRRPSAAERAPGAVTGSPHPLPNG